jgi:hypothetical protein
MWRKGRFWNVGVLRRVNLFDLVQMNSGYELFIYSLLHQKTKKNSNSLRSLRASKPLILPKKEIVSPVFSKWNV